MRENFFQIVNKNIDDVVSKRIFKGVEIPSEFPTIYLDEVIKYKYNNSSILNDKELVEYVLNEEFKKAGWSIKITFFMHVFTKLDINMTIDKIPEKPTTKFGKRILNFLEV